MTTAKEIRAASKEGQDIKLLLKEYKSKIIAESRDRYTESIRSLSNIWLLQSKTDKDPEKRKIASVKYLLANNIADKINGMAYDMINEIDVHSDND